MDRRLNQYFIGIGWFILSIFSSACNDVLAKYLGMRLHSFEVAFFRFLFSSLILIPFIIYYGYSSIKTSRLIVHIIRGFLLFLGMTSWTYGLSLAPVVTATIVSLSIPLFTLILAILFLKEKVVWPRLVATIAGFVGLVLTLAPDINDFNHNVLIFIFAAICFSTLDIINKKFVIKETTISMLFYSALATTAFSAPVSIVFWQTPSGYELLLLFLLGCGGSLILFFLLKAFSLVEATAIAPYRYLEIIISATAGYIIFGDVPNKNTIYGACIVIVATLFAARSEKKRIGNLSLSDDNFIKN